MDAGVLGDYRYLPNDRDAKRRNERTISCQLTEQYLGVLQHRRVQPFREPAVDWRKRIAGFRALAFIAPELREAHFSAQLEKPGTLLPRPHDDELEGAWKATIDPFLNAVVDKVPHHEAVLLTISAIWNLEEEIETNADVSAPDLICRNLERR